MNDAMTQGGSCETMLKYENGAKLRSPSPLIVERKPIGRGVCGDRFWISPSRPLGRTRAGERDVRQPVR